MKRHFLCVPVFVICVALALAIPVQAQNAAIKVLVPGGGERWDVGTQHSIQWKTTGKIDKVQITLIKGNKVISAIAKEITNKGDYIWLVTENLPLDVMERRDVRIRVMSMDGKVVGESARFEIGEIQ